MGGIFQVRAVFQDSGIFQDSNFNQVLPMLLAACRFSYLNPRSCAQFLQPLLAVSSLIIHMGATAPDECLNPVFKKNCCLKFAVFDQCQASRLIVCLWQKL